MVNEVFQNFRVYFGDHIDWEKLHEFNMPELYELKDIKGESNKIADEIKKDIELHSTPPIEKFRFERIFRAPLDVQSSWNEQIARYSPYVVVPLDQINIFLNGGNLTVSEFAGETKMDETIELLMILSKFELTIDHGVSQITEIIEKERNTIIRYMQMIKSQIPCMYDALVERDSSMSKMLTENIGREKFVQFVTEMTDIISDLMTSEQTVPMIQMTYSTIKSKIKSYDYNPLFSRLYFTFLQIRQILLKVDILAELENLNDIHYTLAHGLWKLKTGQFPELENFLDNFFRNTYGSRDFWVRLDVIYHEAVEMVRSMYVERQEQFETYMMNQTIPSLKALKLSMEKLADGDSEPIMTYINSFECNLPELLDQMNNLISRKQLSCMTRILGADDYEQMKVEMSEVPLLRSVRRLIFTDWPEDKVLTQGLDQLLGKIHRMVWLVISGLVGSCPQSPEMTM